MMKRLVVGRPIASADLEHQRISKTVGLAVFSSDAISSTAYATEEILFVLAPAASLAVSHKQLVPIAIGVAVLLAIVVTSYRQTIHAYPEGGGSYMVSKDNLGMYPSLLAGASLLIDYILTVAVSISAGVAAIISIPSLRGLADHRVALCLVLVAVMMLANLRGLKESGTLFAGPTYVYMAVLSVLIVWGLAKVFIGGPFGEAVPVEPDPELLEDLAVSGGSLSMFLVLKGFSSGAVALTGVEAISDGVAAFKRPAAKNAATTMMLMAFILGTLFFGTALLGSRYHPIPSEHVTVMSQLGEAIFGQGNILYYVLQIATCFILTLAANTAFADFPRLSYFVARDGFLPRQFGNRGDRLVFSNGIIFLSVAASVLLVIFRGRTTLLIPLYAVGVFTAFTLNQAGMVRYQAAHRPPGWKLKRAVNAFGAVCTFAVTIVVAVTKFSSGAWVPLVVVPAIMALFLAIKRHYDGVNSALHVPPGPARPDPMNHTVVVLVGRIHSGVLSALSYAKSMRPQHLVALYVATDEHEHQQMELSWEERRIDVPLEVVHSPYRELVEPIERYLDELDDRWGKGTVTVVIPEFIVKRWYHNVLHNQTALRIKGSLLYRPGTVVLSVPYHVE